MEILIVQPVDSIGQLKKKTLVGDASTHPKHYESQFQIITRGWNGWNGSNYFGCLPSAHRLFVKFPNRSQAELQDIWDGMRTWSLL